MTNVITSPNSGKKSKVSPNDLFELLSLKKLGKMAALESLTNQISNSNSGNNNIAKLVLALYNNDTNTLQEIKDQKVMNKSMWNIMEAASKY